MKTLAFGVVLILLLGIGGFMYRHVMETTAPQGVACTMEAKICPDGSAVGRTGPNCEFAACPSGIALGTVPEMTVTLPAGYAENENPNVDRASGGDMTIMREFVKPSLSGDPKHVIRLHDIGVSDEGIEADIVRSVRFSPSDMPAESIDQFKKTVMNGQTWYSIVIERFEGQVESAYFLPISVPGGGMNLYEFTLIERDVTDWTDPNLVIEELPEHKAFLEMLSTLSVGS
jgi:hypothetical protein